jgi:hypothetical protein
MDSTSLTRAPAAGEPVKPDAQAEIERLLTDLAETGTEIVGLRVELAAALEQVEQWRTRYEHAVSWNGRERRGIVTAGIQWLAPFEPEAAPSKPEPEQPDNGRPSRMVAIVAGVLLALVMLGVTLALWPIEGLAIVTGLGVGAVTVGLLWVAMIGGQRQARRRYRRATGKVPARRPVREPRPSARGAVAR